MKVEIKLSHSQVKQAALKAAGIKPVSYGHLKSGVRMQDKKKKALNSAKFQKAFYA